LTNGASASVGMSVVCQKGTVAGSAIVIENTMLTVYTRFCSAVLWRVFFALDYTVTVIVHLISYVQSILLEQIYFSVKIISANVSSIL